jgi:L-aspartate oxidase
MWRHVGLFRTRTALADAVAQLDAAYVRDRARLRGPAVSAAAWRQFNLVTVARLIARAALRREESRGGHYRLDFPARDDRQWQFHAVDAGPA